MRIYLVLIIFCLLFNQNSYSKISNNIIAKIGNKIITDYEVKNKILTTLVLSNEQINQENINKLKKQSLDSLVQKKIKEIELDRYKFSIDKKRVESYLNSISSNNIEDLKKKFIDNNISYSIFLDEIETQFKWQQLIINTYTKQVNVDENIILKEIEEIKKKPKKSLELKLSEIEILRNQELSDKENIIYIQEIINEIGFQNVALKFSISPSASIKGDLGWVNFNSLSKKISKVLENLNVGDVSEPILNANSITFFKIQEKRMTNLESLDLKNIKKNLINRKKNELFNLYSQSLLSKLQSQTLIEYINE